MKKIILFIFAAFLMSICFAQDAENYFVSGQKKFSDGDYKGAVEEYTRAIEADTNYLNGFLQRGFSYVLLGNYELAVKDYTKVIEIHPEHIWAYISRGSAYNKLKKYELAIKDFDKVLKLNPENQEAYNNRGMSKKFSGDMKGACADWKTSKKLGNGEAKIILKNNHCK